LDDHDERTAPKEQLYLTETKYMNTTIMRTVTLAGANPEPKFTGLQAELQQEEALMVLTTIAIIDIK